MMMVGVILPTSLILAQPPALDTKPVQKTVFPELKDTEIGVLVADVAPLIAPERRTVERGTAGFGVGTGSYRVVYVPPLTGKGGERTFLCGFSGRAEKRRWMVEPLTQNMLKDGAFGLGADDYQLVRVLVNNGVGSPESTTPRADTILVSQVERLDGTQFFPKVSDILTDIRELFQEARVRRDREIREAIDKGRGEYLTGASHAGSREEVEESDLAYVTWLPKSEELRAELRHTVTVGRYDRSTGTVHSPQQVAPLSKTRYGVTVGVTVTGVYFITREKKIRSEELKLEPYHHISMPPREAKRDR